MFAAKDRALREAALSCRPVALAAPTRISTDFRQESQTPPLPLVIASPLLVASLRAVASPVAEAGVFSNLRTLLPAQNFQRLCFHSLPHSLNNAQNITPVFPIAPALFARSCARVQYSTLLFSCACALFGKTTGGRGYLRNENLPARPLPRSAVRHDFDVGPIMGLRGCRSRKARNSGNHGHETTDAWRIAA